MNVSDFPPVFSITLIVILIIIFISFWFTPIISGDSRENYDFLTLPNASLKSKIWYIPKLKNVIHYTSSSSQFLLLHRSLSSLIDLLVIFSNLLLIYH